MCEFSDYLIISGLFLCRIVKPQHDMLYTWADPAGPRVIYFEDNGKHIENDLRRDGLNKFQ